MKKNRKLVLLHLLSLFFGSLSHAQNLVNNPGFEVYDKKPRTTSEFYLLPGWHVINNGLKPANTPDWYALKARTDIRLPVISWADRMTLYPEEGNAVVGFIALSNTGIHEYLTNVLTQPIRKGERVTCSFYYTNGAGYSLGKNKARLGVYFSSSLPVTSTQLLPVTPQAQMKVPQFNNEWEKYEVEFVAGENYSFLTIGCFDEHYNSRLYTSATDKGIYSDWAYYFIDNVSVITETDSTDLSFMKQDKKNSRTIRLLFKTNDTQESIRVKGQVVHSEEAEPFIFNGAEVIVRTGQEQQIKVEGEAEGYFPFSETINSDSIAALASKSHTFYLSSVQKGSTIVLNHIYFDTGSPVLLPASFSELDRLIELLHTHPEMKILIAGHTDNLGDPQKDMILSEQRAQNVKQYLIEKGIRSNRLSAKGYGITRPIADNKTPAGRAKNRRVEFSVR